MSAKFRSPTLNQVENAIVLVATAATVALNSPQNVSTKNSAADIKLLEVILGYRLNYQQFSTKYL